MGGRRRASPDSPNTAWRNASFRGYADYMSSTEFALGLVELLQLASTARTAMMCAEALWWRCHRSMIADALCARAIEVVHILDAKYNVVHPMTSPARIVRGKLSYCSGARTGTERGSGASRDFGPAKTPSRIEDPQAAKQKCLISSRFPSLTRVLLSASAAERRLLSADAPEPFRCCSIS
jgi:hypothetical protein